MGRCSDTSPSVDLSLLPGVRRAVLSTFIFISTLIPLADCLNVYINVRSERPRALFIHCGTAVFMIILASLIMHGRRAEGNKQSAAVNEIRRTA